MFFRIDLSVKLSLTQSLLLLNQSVSKLLVLPVNFECLLLQFYEVLLVLS